MAGTTRDIGPALITKNKDVWGEGGAHAEWQNGVNFFDDFTGRALDTTNVYTAGGTGTAPALAVAANGTVRLTTNTTGGMSSQLGVGEIVWKPSFAASGYPSGVFAEFRLTTPATLVATKFTVGLVDAKTYGSDNLPITITTGTPTANASNGVVWVFDSAATNATWQGVGVKATVATALVNSAVAVVAATAYRLRIEITSAGTAIFKLLKDKERTAPATFIGSVANATTASTLLVPHISVKTTDTTSKNLDLDYVLVGQSARS